MEALTEPVSAQTASEIECVLVEAFRATAKKLDLDHQGQTVRFSPEALFKGKPIPEGTRLVLHESTLYQGQELSHKTGVAMLVKEDA